MVYRGRGVRRVCQQLEHFPARFGTAEAARYQLIEHGSKVIGKVIGKEEVLARHGLGEPHLEGMQELPIQPEVRIGVLGRTGVVHRIAHQRMFRVLHVNADLMGSARVQLAVDKGVAVVARTMLSSTRNVVSASRAEGHSRTAMRVRSLSERAMGASIMPVSCGMTPCTKAR